MLGFRLHICIKYATGNWFTCIYMLYYVSSHIVNLKILVAPSNFKCFSHQAVFLYTERKYDKD